MLTGLVPRWFRSALPKVENMRVGTHKIEPKPTIRVIMLQTKLGAPDGITTVEYEAGKQYDIPEDLAETFFSTHSADPADAYEALDNAPEHTHPAPATTPRKRARR